MVETYFFFSWSSVCGHGVWVLDVNGTWDMGHDGTGFNKCFCLARFTASSLFLFIHFSAYTEKGPGGLGLGWVWVGLLVHHIFFIFSGTHVW